MSGRILGTVGYLARYSPPNRYDLLRCNVCGVNYDKIYPSGTRQCRQSPVIISRNFSFDSLTRFPSTLFRFIAESDASELLRNTLIHVHDTTGLPWWGTIFLSAVALKAWAFPFRTYQIVLTNRMQKISMSEICKEVQVDIAKKHKAYDWSLQKAQHEYKLETSRRRKQLIDENHCHPGRIILLGFMELPMWMFLSITWRTVAYGFSDNIHSSIMLKTQMSTEGLFWFMNLTVPDPYYILPAMVFIVQMIQIEIGQIQAASKNPKLTRLFMISTNLGRAFAVIAAIICSYLPASVSFFWLSSSVLVVAMEFLLLSEKVRRTFNLPPSKLTQKDMVLALKDRLLMLTRLKIKK